MDIDNNNYSVYISFDNKDSSITSFVNYLRATFNRHGVHQLDDQSDRPAEKIRVLVVVLSRNYTFSALENLVNHLNMKDLVVVTVRHGITVQSVNQKIAAVLESWSSEDQVTMWPRVLLESAVLPGHVYNEERSESEFMEEIARDVFEKLYPTEEIGIHMRQLEIQNLLCKQPWGLRTLGIFGEPGIGKTTLARAVFRQMSGGYDASCFIKDFHTECNEKRLEYLPIEYLSETPMEKFHLNSFDSGPRHRKKRVLVALDKVQNAGDAMSYLGGYDQFGPGSLIIITSQDKNILEECKMNEIYELNGLNDEDALKLFTRCAFGKDVTEENHLDHSMKEIECFGGNPYDLRSYANGFKGKAMVEMGPALSDVCEVFITDHDVSPIIPKNTIMRINSYGEDDEPQENEELPSYHDAVLATGDYKPIILTPSNLCPEREFQSYSQKNPGFGIYNQTKSLPSNLRFFPLDYNAVKRTLSEHLHQKHRVLVQGFASQLQKLWQSFSNSRDLSKLEHDLQLLLNLAGGCSRIKYFIDVVRKNRELNLNGIYGIREKRSGTTGLLKINFDRDKPNGLGQC